jgi:F-type H+-transporting ATPase subunit gamma
MAQIREIKKRMVAVGTIQRITKTMQMIATAKFTAAAQRAKATKPYTQKVRQLVQEVTAAAGDVSHPLIDGPAEATKKELLLIISSDRGLCGAYNGNVFRKATQHLREMRDKGLQLDIEIVGKKAVAYCRFQHIAVAARHTLGDKPRYEDVEQIAEKYMAEFSAGKYDAIRIASMRFVSNSKQIPEVVQLLPLKPPTAADASAPGESSAESPAESQARPNYEFSPSSEALLADLLPLSVKATLFQAMNDAVVSEQIMRMVAMKAATEKAKDLGRRLRRNYNRARQTRITTELNEIVSGAAALG